MELAQKHRAEYLDYDHEQRIREDTVTWLAEVLDGSMRVPTEFRYDGQELIAGDGSSLRSIFEKSVKTAELETAYNPQLAFELRRRWLELDEYHLMVAMAEGLLPNTMVVVSDFPPELMEKGTDIGGYNTTRKQTMLRVISADESGNIRMFTQSLDGTDRKALENVYQSLGFQAQEGELLGQRMHLELADEEQEFMVDQLMGVYDRSLSEQYGGNWRAGRQQLHTANTYDFVRQQSDLIEAFVAAKLRNPGAAESLRYGLAAAMERRFRSGPELNVVRGISAAMQIEADVWAEMQQAGRQAQSEGRTFSGCGISSKAAADAAPSDDNGPQSDLGEAGYGDEDKKENWSWKPGICRVQECPTRPGKTKVGPCAVCVGCQHLFDKGKDPNAEYKARKRNAKYN